MIDLTSEENQDILLQKTVNEDTLCEGMIVDANDYLGEWHLSIVCKVDESNDGEFAKLNFLRYPKGNRDEWYAKNELADRISGPFLNVDFKDKDSHEAVQKVLNNLRDYFKKFQDIKSTSKDGTNSSGKDKKSNTTTSNDKKVFVQAGKKEEAKQFVVKEEQKKATKLPVAQS